MDPQVPVRRAVVVVAVVVTAGMHRESLPHATATATTAATARASCEMKRRSPHPEGEKFLTMNLHPEFSRPQRMVPKWDGIQNT